MGPQRLVRVAMHGSPEAALYDRILGAPGIHLREAARRCRLTLGTTHARLADMEARGLLECREDGRYRRYFVAGELSPAQQWILAACRSERARWIVEVLLDRPFATEKDICAAGNVSQGAVAKVLRRLHARGVVELRAGRRDRAYALVDRAQAIELLTRFADSFHARSLAEPWPMEAPAASEEAERTTPG